MKKLASAILSLVFVFSFAACSNSNSNSSSTNTTTQSQQSNSSEASKATEETSANNESSTAAAKRLQFITRQQAVQKRLPKQQHRLQTQILLKLHLLSLTQVLTSTGQTITAELVLSIMTKASEMLSLQIQLLTTGNSTTQYLSATLSGGVLRHGLLTDSLQQMILQAKQSFRFAHLLPQVQDKAVNCWLRQQEQAAGRTAKDFLQVLHQTMQQTG